MNYRGLIAIVVGLITSTIIGYYFLNAVRYLGGETLQINRITIYAMLIIAIFSGYQVSKAISRGDVLGKSIWTKIGTLFVFVAVGSVFVVSVDPDKYWPGMDAAIQYLREGWEYGFGS